MLEPLFVEYLKGLSADDRNRIGTREILWEPGCIADTTALVMRYYGAGAEVFVLSDRNTEVAAGTIVKDALRTFTLRELILGEVVHPDRETVGRVATAVERANPDLVIVVGSGVLSDIGKRVALECEVPNWVVATAPSVDAYSAPRSALHFDNYHQSVPAWASEVVVCDPDVVANAPRRLIAAGIGDLFAKFTAYLDWQVANFVTGESIDFESASIALKSGRRGLEGGVAFAKNPIESSMQMMDGAITSGLAMQLVGNSRPAAGLEHTVAHFWQQSGAVENADLNLHGVLTGVATRQVAALYRTVYRTLATVDVLPEGVALRRPESLPEDMEPFAKKIDQESAARDFSQEGREARRAAFIEHREEIANLADAVLGEIDRHLPRLPSEIAVDAIRLDPHRLRQSFRYAPLLRNRYGGLDLAWDTGIIEHVIAEHPDVFGVGL